jgi:NADPH2:quinone reductase
MIIPHSDGAGDIDAVGANVGNRIGERVWIWNGQYRRPFGTAAEFIVVPSTQAVRLPDNTEYTAGACFGVPLMTALEAVRLAEVSARTTVLIIGGGGAVAHYAIQIAKRRGARVITTVSNAAKADHARAAGADDIIDYRSENVVACIKDLTGGAGVDALIDMDMAANGELYPSLLRPHATAVIYGMSENRVTLPTLSFMRNSLTLRLFRVYDIPEQVRAEAIAELTQLLEADQLRHTIARVMPLDKIAEAHELSEQGAVIGNIVLSIAP